MICWNHTKGSDTSYHAIVEKAITILTKEADDFDALISGGHSGLLVAAPIAYALGKPLGIVRREGKDGQHQGNHSHLLGIKKALFVDDHFGGGSTFRACREALLKAHQVISDADLAYYEQQYGKAECQKRWPHFYETPEEAGEIVAIYMYNPTHRHYNYHGYHHVREGDKFEAQRYNLYPKDEFERISKGYPAKEPTKSAVKKVVKEVVRDQAGRFAPKPKSPRRQVVLQNAATRKRKYITVGPF